MSATSITVRGRAAAQALMVDVCTIGRGAGEQPVFDPDTGGYADPAATGVYAGPCRVKPTGNASRVVEAAGQHVSLWPYVVSVPMSVSTVEVDDLVTVTASALDPQLVGAVLRVRYVEQGSHITARRLGCEVRT